MASWPVLAQTWTGYCVVASWDFAFFDEDLESSEGRKVIALNLDETDDDSKPQYYESNDCPQQFDTTRSFIHEVVHAMTHLQDKEDSNPRGPVV